MYCTNRKANKLIIFIDDKRFNADKTLSIILRFILFYLDTLNELIIET